MISPATVSKPTTTIFYPESDGSAHGRKHPQLNWIIGLVTNLRALFRDNVNVFVAGNQFWYPVEGEPEIRLAPDVYVVFGRPKGIVRSYKQWEEGGIPMTVVWEILSPGNTYSGNGGQAYVLRGLRRRGILRLRPGQQLAAGLPPPGRHSEAQRPMDGFVSPRLGIRFDLSGPELVVRYPDGQPFLTFEELATERDLLAAERNHLAAERDQAQQRRAPRRTERQTTSPTSNA